MPRCRPPRVSPSRQAAAPSCQRGCTAARASVPRSNAMGIPSSHLLLASQPSIRQRPSQGQLAIPARELQSTEERGANVVMASPNTHLLPVPLPPRTSHRPPGKDAKAKAAKAAKALKKNTWKKQRKPRFTAVFHRPKTLIQARKPKYERKRCVVSVVR